METDVRYGKSPLGRLNRETSAVGVPSSDSDTNRLENGTRILDARACAVLEFVMVESESVVDGGMYCRQSSNRAMSSGALPNEKVMTGLPNDCMIARHREQTCKSAQ